MYGSRGRQPERGSTSVLRAHSFHASRLLEKRIARKPFNDSPRWKPGLYFADDPTVEVLSDVHAL
jgi:hypothetical protein